MKIWWGVHKPKPTNKAGLYMEYCSTLEITNIISLVTSISCFPFSISGRSRTRSLNYMNTKFYTTLIMRFFNGTFFPTAQVKYCQARLEDGYEWFIGKDLEGDVRLEIARH
jgi:hypothetical protein